MKILSVLYIVVLISLSNCIKFSLFSNLFSNKSENKSSLNIKNETKNETKSNTSTDTIESSNKMKKSKKSIESIKINDDEFMLQMELKRYDIERSNAFAEMMF